MSASGKIQLPHTCPNCKKVTAITYQELEGNKNFFLAFLK